MTYNKPEVLKLDNALHSIQATDKFTHVLPDSIQGQPKVSANAYEADE